MKSGFGRRACHLWQINLLHACSRYRRIPCRWLLSTPAVYCARAQALWNPTKYSTFKIDSDKKITKFLASSLSWLFLNPPHAATSWSPDIAHNEFQFRSNLRDLAAWHQSQVPRAIKFRKLNYSKVSLKAKTAKMPICQAHLCALFICTVCCQSLVGKT